MRRERLARLAYQGDAWETDGSTYIKARTISREAFERALERFVTLLTRHEEKEQAPS